MRPVRFLHRFEAQPKSISNQLVEDLKKVETILNNYN